MAGGSSEKRRRPHIAQTRLSREEAALVRERAARAGTSVSALIRHAVLNEKPPRASRQPSADQQEIARLIASLGDTAQALRDATSSGDQGAVSAQVDAAHRDIADMCFACRKALGLRQ